MSEQEIVSDYDWNERTKILYRCDLSVIYNRKRERFFVLCDRWAKCVSLIASGAAFSSFLDTTGSKAVAGVIVSLVTLPSLLFGWSDKARQHAELAQSYLHLLADIAKKGPRTFTEADLNEWMAQLSLIEKNEPAVLSAVMASAHNRLASQQNSPEMIIEIPFRKKIFAHLFDTHIDWHDRSGLGKSMIPGWIDAK
ncbi:hypothetical protein [Duganella sp. Root336D2]|uniref:hypothetical protein n=1 Tax=Duganella sp. Root336D2 TaxID=1736518 RepID=UPI0006FAA475|nr:hypothetical protein [Duganella sp. Root336D2]KQV51898.1 hypothetical protein ASD07_29485 [Duganella sp. Root336D2]